MKKLIFILLFLLSLFIFKHKIAYYVIYSYIEYGCSEFNNKREYFQEKCPNSDLNVVEKICHNKKLKEEGIKKILTK